LGAHASAVNALVFSPGSDRLYTAAEDGTLKFWQLPVTAPRLLPPHEVTALALSQDSQVIVTGSVDKSVRLLNFDNGQLMRQMTGPARALSAVAVSPNRAVAAGGGADGRLFVWNTGDGKLLYQYSAHKGPVTALSFSPQSNQLLTGGSDG